MQVMGNLFNIVLFVTLAGSVFAILSLLANRVFRFALPLWFGVCGMALWLLPLPAPGLELISPEEQFWLWGYCIACFVWAAGAVLFTLFFVMRSVLARCAVRKYPVCTDRRVMECLSRCVRLAGCRKTPPVYYGTLSNPACVAGVFRPVIIVKEEVVKRLTDGELMAVLCHEITHIRRGHILLGGVYDYACAINWFNPLIWILKGDFALHCEVDCDRYALRCPGIGVTEAGYASAMLRLLELSVVSGGKTGFGLGALGFPITRKRIELILEKTGKIREAVMLMAVAVILTAVLCFAVSSSRGFFYPYPARQMGTEYTDHWSR